MPDQSVLLHRPPERRSVIDYIRELFRIVNLVRGPLLVLAFIYTPWTLSQPFAELFTGYMEIAEVKGDYHAVTDLISAVSMSALFAHDRSCRGCSSSTPTRLAARCRQRCRKFGAGAALSPRQFKLRSFAKILLYGMEPTHISARWLTMGPGGAPTDSASKRVRCGGLHVADEGTFNPTGRLDMAEARDAFGTAANSFNWSLHPMLTTPLFAALTDINGKLLESVASAQKDWG